MISEKQRKFENNKTIPDYLVSYEDKEYYSIWSYVRITQKVADGRISYFAEYMDIDSCTTPFKEFFGLVDKDSLTYTVKWVYYGFEDQPYVYDTVESLESDLRKLYKRKSNKVSNPDISIINSYKFGKK